MSTHALIEEAAVVRRTNPTLPECTVHETFSCRLGCGRTLATPGGLEPPTNSLEGCCSIQLSYGARHQVAVPEWHVPCSMGPVVCPAPFEILRIRFLQQPLG